MLKLAIYSDAFGEPSGSPFCVKAMCLLHMSGVDWQPDYQNDPRKTPKGKFPTLLDGSNTIADSDQIRGHLETNYSIDFDSHLTDEQKAVSRAITRTFEEHFYFIIQADRWENDANWTHVKDVFFGHLPPVIRSILPGIVRKQALRQGWEQGVRRHSEEERLERAKKDIAAVLGILGKKKFLFGSKPSAADATVIPMLRAAAVAPVPTLVSKAINENDALMKYLERGREALYPKV